MSDQLAARFARVRCVETLDVAEQEEGVSAHEMRHQSSEPVIVAEADLVGGDGVVLVDDGDNTQPEEPGHGVQRVAVRGGAQDILHRQQQLRHQDAVLGKRLRVVTDQESLTHRCGSLLSLQVAGPAAQAKWCKRRRDGTGGDQHHPSPRVVQLGQRGGDLAHTCDVELPVRGGQRRGSDLDHDAVGISDLTAHQEEGSSGVYPPVA